VHCRRGFIASPCPVRVCDQWPSYSCEYTIWASNSVNIPLTWTHRAKPCTALQENWPSTYMDSKAWFESLTAYDHSGARMKSIGAEADNHDVVFCKDIAEGSWNSRCSNLSISPSVDRILRSSRDCRLRPTTTVADSIALRNDHWYYEGPLQQPGKRKFKGPEVNGSWKVSRQKRGKTRRVGGRKWMSRYTAKRQN